MSRILILARDYREAQMLARRYELPPREWRYVDTDREFRGRPYAQTIATHCWSEGRHWADKNHIWGALLYWPFKPNVAWVECP